MLFRKKITYVLLFWFGFKNSIRASKIPSEGFKRLNISFRRKDQIPRIHVGQWEAAFPLNVSERQVTVRRGVFHLRCHLLYEQRRVCMLEGRPRGSLLREMKWLCWNQTTSAAPLSSLLLSWVFSNRLGKSPALVNQRWMKWSRDECVGRPPAPSRTIKNRQCTGNALKIVRCNCCHSQDLSVRCVPGAFASAFLPAGESHLRGGTCLSSTCLFWGRICQNDKICFCLNRLREAPVYLTHLIQKTMMQLG